MGKIVGSIIGARGENKAIGRAVEAQTQAATTASRDSLTASREANALQERMFGRQTELYNQNVARQEPIRHAGLTAQNRLMDVLGLSMNKGAQGYGSAAASFADKPFQVDPGYQFRLEQGQKALERSAAARGGLLSGRAMKDTQDYGQGLASQEYGNSFNRFQTERANTLNPLFQLSQYAQNATGAQGQAGQVMGQQAGQYGRDVGDTITGTQDKINNNLYNSANARASGYIGKAKNRSEMFNVLGSSADGGFSNKKSTGSFF